MFKHHIKSLKGTSSNQEALVGIFVKNVLQKRRLRAIKKHALQKTPRSFIHTAFRKDHHEKENRKEKNKQTRKNIGKTSAKARGIAGALKIIAKVPPHFL